MREEGERGGRWGIGRRHGSGWDIKSLVGKGWTVEEAAGDEVDGWMDEVSKTDEVLPRRCSCTDKGSPPPLTVY